MKKVSNTSTFIIAIAATFLTAMEARAQRQLNASFRTGFNMPVNDLGSAELKNGGGFDATISYRFFPRVAIYAGWGWNSFSPTQTMANAAHFEETGYRFGLQFNQPLGAGSGSVFCSAPVE